MRQELRNFRDNGASESIGFLLIFTIVMMGIGLVTLYGYPMLIQQQTGADEQIMEKNMIVLQNDFKSLVYKTVPYKETALKIGGGTLEVNSYLQSTNHGPGFEIKTQAGEILAPMNNTGQLRYQSSASQAEISLENGAVVKQDPSVSGSVMLAEPRWFYDTQTGTMVINLVWVNTTKYMSHTGIGTVQMALGPTDYIREDYTIAGAQRIIIRYSPDTRDYGLAWKGYMEKDLNMQCTGSPVMTCTTNNAVSTIVVKRTEIVVNSI